MFISLKKGFKNIYITASTISRWFLDTIKLAFERADGEVLQVNRVKVHEVRALSASLDFKGGIPVEIFFPRASGGHTGRLPTSMLA